MTAADGKSGVGDDELTFAAISTSPPSSADLYSESPREIRLVFKGNGYLQDNIWEASDNTISLLEIAQVRDNQPTFVLPRQGSRRRGRVLGRLSAHDRVLHDPGAAANLLVRGFVG